MQQCERFAFPISEVCFLAGDVSRATVYQEIAAGRLRARKLRGRTLILREDLQAWLGDAPTLQAGLPKLVGG